MFTLLIIYTVCAMIREQIIIAQNDRAAEEAVRRYQAAHPDEKFIHLS